jgi:hypothetical protein
LAKKKRRTSLICYAKHFSQNDTEKQTNKQTNDAGRTITFLSYLDMNVCSKNYCVKRSRSEEEEEEEEEEKHCT